MGEHADVFELRLVVTAEVYEAALVFYRDMLGLPELEAYRARGGHVAILATGRATLEISDPPYAEYIDEVEVGRRVAGHIRVAFGVRDSPRRPNASSAPAHVLLPSRP